MDDKTYNFTERYINESRIWVNKTYNAMFDTTTQPTISMAYNGTLGAERYEVNMTLLYMQEKTYNCSIFNVTYPEDSGDVVSVMFDNTSERLKCFLNDETLVHEASFEDVYGIISRLTPFNRFC
ncbi:hypothetical protein MTO96_040119 [Rhipicephalus appendiculatus]